MTREEAITNLNMISVAFVEPITKEQRELIDETFDMAIKALEEKPCDCISRAEAQTEIMMFAGNEKNNDDIYIKVSDAVELLRELPPVQPQTEILLNQHDSELNRVKDELETKADYKAFAEWVASEIFTEEWEYNKDAFAEIACRKLNKLGIVASEGNVWTLKESED